MSRIIPFDIELEIIRRLPVKSLIRSISVCKAWKSLIVCSRFIAGYRVRPTQPHHLLIMYKVGDRQETEVKSVCFVDDDTFPQQKFDPAFPPLVQLLNRFRIIDSCQGLLCFYGLFPEPNGSKTRMAVLWNPSTRKSIAVVVPPNPTTVPPPFKFVLGFGVCPDTKDPKLVKIIHFDDYRKLGSKSGKPCQVMLFTLSSGKWTCLCCNMPSKSIQFSCFPVVIGRFIYWVAYDWIDAGVGFYKNLIMSFDLVTDEFREVDIPDSMRESHLSISRRRESLVLLRYNINATNKEVCDVWMMMKHGDRKTFTKQFTIKAPNASVLVTLGFRNSGEPIIEMQDDDDDDDDDSPCALVVYESCLERIKDLGICGTNHSFSLKSYTESLLLLDHDDGCIIRC